MVGCVGKVVSGKGRVLAEVSLQTFWLNIPPPANRYQSAVSREPR